MRHAYASSLANPLRLLSFSPDGTLFSSLAEVGHYSLNIDGIVRPSDQGLASDSNTSNTRFFLRLPFALIRYCPRAVETASSCRTVFDPFLLSHLMS